MLPCEIFVSKLLPSIRRQIALQMLKEGKSQREIAKSIGITDAAVSQYIKKKRGHNKLPERVAQNAMRFYSAKLNFGENICKMCQGVRSSGDLCILHTNMKNVDFDECVLCLTACR